MRPRLLFLGWLIICCSALRAQGRYAVELIPAALLKDASVVKRMEDLRFELVKPDEVVCRKKIALTILNESGREYAPMAVGYDRLRKVTVFEGALYDARGNLLKKAKNKDIQDYSDVQDISLFDDNRMKVLDFNHPSYPYTVEYEVEVKMNNSYSFIDWMPQPYSAMSVESSSYTLVIPEGYKPRYRAVNYAGEPIIQPARNKRSMTWKLTSLPALKKMFAAPLLTELTPHVLFSPSAFEMEGYRGSAASWEELGRFALLLNRNRDKLPDDLLLKVTALTKDLPDDRKKAEALYDFLQKNTRYVSIQLGIGGLQPFTAAFVAKNGYGDCKALCNYMYSLLKAAGIRSHYTLVRAGSHAEDRQLAEDFPSDKFNHVILCVPLASDTLWLECTSPTTPPGYMGSFTGNRKALLITENGGVLVSTPRYGLEENTQLRTIKGTIKPDGTLQMNIATTYKGMQHDRLAGVLTQLSMNKVKQYLQEKLQLATYQVNHFDYQEKRSALPELYEQLDLTVNGYATITGKRLFVTPNILNADVPRLTEEDRTVDFVFESSFRTEDRVEMEVPEGYVLEAAPKEVTLKTDFGFFRASAKLDGNKIVYIRIREQYSVRLPASRQEEIIRFFEEIYRADHNRFVLVTTTTNVR